VAFALRYPRRTGPTRRDYAEGAYAEGAAPAEGAAAPRRGRLRVAAGRGAWAAGSLMLTLARIVRLAVTLLVALIVAAILLRVFSANPGNVIVRDIHDAARAVVSPFNNLFSISNAKVAIAVNWGIAAIVYAIVGGFIARVIARSAPRGLAPGEPVAR